MPHSFEINRIVANVPFIDFVQELVINRPGREIVSVSPENRMRVNAFAVIFATHTDEELLDIMAPFHITGDEERILKFIRAIRLCTRLSRPRHASQV